MKKILSVSLLSIFLAGCVGSNEKEPSTSDKSKETAHTDPEEVVEKPPLITEDDVFTEGTIEQLVNPDYLLSETYEPEDLEYVDLPSTQDTWLRSDANQALSEMFEAGEQEDIHLYAVSGYRSYDMQVELYNNYSREYGEEEAKRFSAYPGSSEHQTGLSMDVTSESVVYDLKEDFEDTAEGTWVKENAHQFGFIVRYPEGQEDITGYIYEPWHIRYLGKELAKEVYDSGLTYEEYIEDSGIELTKKD